MKVKALLEYLFQIVLIVFSVGLALFLNEVRTDKKIQNNKNLALINLKSEVQENKVILSDLIPYHLEVIHRLDSVIENYEALEAILVEGQLDLLELAPKGIYERLPSNATWEIANLSGTLAEFSFDELHYYYLIYDQQAVTFKPADKIVEIIFSRQFMDTSKSKENAIMIRNGFRELVGRERSLLTYYNQALTQNQNN